MGRKKHKGQRRQNSKAGGGGSLRICIECREEEVRGADPRKKRERCMGDHNML